jgi:hypothetical protein
VIVPDVSVDGVGAVALPTPPVALLYHNKLLPVAVSGAEGAPWQYFTGLLTTGAAGVLLTVTVMDDLGLSQEPVDWLTQYISVVSLVVGGVGAVALPVPPEAVVYHNKFVPVAVNGLAVAPWQ